MCWTCGCGSCLVFGHHCAEPSPGPAGRCSGFHSNNFFWRYHKHPKLGVEIKFDRLNPQSSKMKWGVYHTLQGFNHILTLIKISPRPVFQIVGRRLMVWCLVPIQSSSSPWLPREAARATRANHSPANGARRGLWLDVCKSRLVGKYFSALEKLCLESFQFKIDCYSWWHFNHVAFTEPCKAFDKLACPETWVCLVNLNRLYKSLCIVFAIFIIWHEVVSQLRAIYELLGASCPNMLGPFHFEGGSLKNRQLKPM